MRCPRIAPIVLLLATAAACSEGDSDSVEAERGAVREPEQPATGGPARTGAADAMGPGRDGLGPEDLVRGRHDRGWMAFAEEDRAGRGVRDSLGTGGSGGDAPGASPSTEIWDDIGGRPVDVDPAALPLHGEVEGPSVLAVQILLDRARFSPGVADGYWGKNTEKALYWLQSERGLRATGRLDGETLELLRREAGATGPLSREVRLTEQTVSGPFVTVPDDVYEQESMECLCYESLAEKLAEHFHTTREVLGALNPGVDLDGLSAGDALVVPDHGGPTEALGARDPGNRGPVTRLVISDGGHYLHALAADGSILYHFPTTLGSEYAPSPSGSYAIDGVAHDPDWHYQPEILDGVDPSGDDAIVPAGPNNPVGVVWIDLSEPHYGIHGTAEPSTIGYVTSSGCVRLTNWDVAFLAERAGVGAGVPVEFRSGRGRAGG
jgi:lipoprotein-anchoring transpeptidase ErfK/SrfK